MPAAGRLGDKSQCPHCSHGCPACGHSVTGPAVTGSPNVRINSKPALRVGDRGEHASCCGGNTWEAVQGAPGVRVNGRPAFRVGDAAHHCGGMGKLVEGSSNVNIGNYSASAPGGGGVSRAPEHIVWFRVVDHLQRALAGIVTHIERATGELIATLRTDAHGHVRVPVHVPGEYHIKIGPAPSPAQQSSLPQAVPARVRIGTTEAQPLSGARPTIHPLGWDIRVESPSPGGKHYIEPGRFDAARDRGENPSPPLMPTLTLRARVYFTREGRREEVHDGRLIWDFRIKGRYRVRARGESRGYRMQPYDLPAGRFASAPGETIEATLAPAEVVGGDLEVYVQYEAEPHSPHAGVKVADVVACGEILGRNPERRDLHAFIAAQAEYRRAVHARRGADYGNLAWLFFRLFAHESSQRQFNPASSRGGRAAATAEKPNYADPAGVGISQRDPEAREWHFRAGGPSANLHFTNEFWPRIYWNWKENVIAGIETFYDKLWSAHHRLHGWAERVRRANRGASVPSPPDGVVIREALRNYNGGTEYQLKQIGGGWFWQREPMLGSKPYPRDSENYGYPDRVLNIEDAAFVPAGQYPVPATVRIERAP